MTAVLEKLFAVAHKHGEGASPTNTESDLQSLLRSAWELMTENQRLRFLDSGAVTAMLEGDHLAEFNGLDLVDEYVQFLKKGDKERRDAFQRRLEPR